MYDATLQLNRTKKNGKLRYTLLYLSFFCTGPEGLTTTYDKTINVHQEFTALPFPVEFPCPSGVNSLSEMIISMAFQKWKDFMVNTMVSCICCLKPILWWVVSALFCGSYSYWSYFSSHLVQLFAGTLCCPGGIADGIVIGCCCFCNHLAEIQSATRATSYSGLEMLLGTYPFTEIDVLLIYDII